LQEEQLLQVQKLASIDAGNPVNLRLKKYRNAENRIKASREDYVAQRITKRISATSE
jgi:hypothetical protein